MDRRPCSRVSETSTVNTGCECRCHFRHPCSRAVNNVNTNSVYRALVFLPHKLTPCLRVFVLHIVPKSKSCWHKTTLSWRKKRSSPVNVTSSEVVYVCAVMRNGCRKSDTSVAIYYVFGRLPLSANLQSTWLTHARWHRPIATIRFCCCIRGCFWTTNEQNKLLSIF